MFAAFRSPAAPYVVVLATREGLPSVYVFGFGNLTEPPTLLLNASYDDEKFRWSGDESSGVFK